MKQMNSSAIIVWAVILYAAHVNGATVHITGPDERQVEFGDGTTSFATLSGGSGYINSTVSVYAPDFETMSGTSMNQMVTVLVAQQAQLAAALADNAALHARIDALELANFNYDCSVGANVIVPKGALGLPNEAFKECDALETVSLPASLETVSKQAFYAATSLRVVTFAEGTSNLTAIADEAFYQTTALTSITLPPGLRTIGVHSFALSGLTSITLPPSLRELAYRTFAYCQFTSITLPEGLTEIPNRCFQHCQSLVSITLPSSLTKIDVLAFADCRVLARVIVPLGCIVEADAFGHEGASQNGWEYAPE